MYPSFYSFVMSWNLCCVIQTDGWKQDRFPYWPKTSSLDHSTLCYLQDPLNTSATQPGLLNQWMLRATAPSGAFSLTAWLSLWPSLSPTVSTEGRSTGGSSPQLGVLTDCTGLYWDPHCLQLSQLEATQLEAAAPSWVFSPTALAFTETLTVSNCLNWRQQPPAGCSHRLHWPLLRPSLSPTVSTGGHPIGGSSPKRVLSLTANWLWLWPSLSPTDLISTGICIYYFITPTCFRLNHLIFFRLFTQVHHWLTARSRVNMLHIHLQIICIILLYN